MHVPAAQGDGAAAELDLEQMLAPALPVGTHQQALGSPAASSAAAAAASDRPADAENVPLGGLQHSMHSSLQSRPSVGVDPHSGGAAGPSSSAAANGDPAGRVGARKMGQPLAELSAAPSEDSQKSSADVSQLERLFLCPPCPPPPPLLPSPDHSFVASLLVEGRGAGGAKQGFMHCSHSILLIACPAGLN